MPAGSVGGNNSSGRLRVVLHPALLARLPPPPQAPVCALHSSPTAASPRAAAEGEEGGSDVEVRAGGCMPPLEGGCSMEQSCRQPAGMLAKVQPACWTFSSRATLCASSRSGCRGLAAQSRPSGMQPSRTACGTHMHTPQLVCGCCAAHVYTPQLVCGCCAAGRGRGQEAAQEEAAA